MLQVTRWQKNGHDRLYANAPDGGQAGWLDVRTRARTITNPALASKVDHLFDLHEGKLGELAGNRAGRLVREEAIKEFRAKPIRTILNQVFDVVHTQERAWRLGAQGEEETGAVLDGLMPAWRTVHSIPCPGGWDLDHLTVGPGGAFVVNAKHHPTQGIWVGGNTVLVDGSRANYVAQVRRQADFATERLSAALGMPVQVHGALAFVGDGRLKVKTPPADVLVFDSHDLVSALRNLPLRLDKATMKATYAAATHSSTWA